MIELMKKIKKHHKDVCDNYFWLSKNRSTFVNIVSALFVCDLFRGKGVSLRCSCELENSYISVLIFSLELCMVSCWPLECWTTASILLGCV